MNDRISLISDNTKLIYDEDAYIMDFSAKVILCSKTEDGKYEIVLDQTAFFPEGGGQSSDTGCIGKANISEVYIEDNKVVHLSDTALTEGEIYECHIDFEKRYDRMQNHSAEHLFCGLICAKYGFDNVGFHLNDEVTILDVSGALDNEALLEVEKRANEIIYENVKITVSYPSKEELVNLEYRSKLDLLDGVRLVTIEGYDVCACCAPHVRTTGEIGCIKVIDSFAHRGGTRITLLAGKRAYMDYQALNQSNKKIMGLVSSKRLEIEDGVSQLLVKNQKLNDELVKLKTEMTKMVTDSVILEINKRAEDDKRPVLVFSESFDDIQMRNLINKVVKEYGCIVAGFMGDDNNGYRYIIGGNKDSIISVDGEALNLSLFAKKLNEALNGRGGGSPQMIQGSVASKRDMITDYINAL